MSLIRRVRRDRSQRTAQNPRRRRFALTLNNPTPAEAVKWNTVIVDGNVAEHAKDLTFFVVQTEKGDGSVGDSALGTVHYQAYCEFKKAVEWSAVKKIFGDRIHIENARANAACNIRYCTKNRTRFEGGDICIAGQWGTPKKGGGAMLCAIKILNGAKKDQIVEEHPDICMLNMPKVEAFIANAKGPRTEKPKVTILYGLTGSGKTQYCVRTYGSEVYWVPPPDSGRVWFGHYMGQDVCVFDDFHAGWFTLTHLLRILDSTPLLVAPKGGQVPFNSGQLVFTSNVDPRDWYSAYKGKKAHKDALQRRIVDFAEIFDCIREEVGTPHGPVWISRMVKRTETFTFREGFGYDFAAGVGDMTEGNGF